MNFLLFLFKTNKNNKQEKALSKNVFERALIYLIKESNFSKASTSTESIQ
jgi:hypothetical protein